jgi:hypothetical protein
MDGKQFYKEDYKSHDYGTLMNKYEHKLEHKQKIQEKKMTKQEWATKKKIRTWTEADQLFEDQLWES